MNTLPPFSLSARVQSEEGKQDSITLELGDWFIQGIGNSLGAFVDLLGPRPADDETGGGNINAWANILTTAPVATLNQEFFGWMFNRPAGNFDQQTEMDLRTGGSGSGSRPGAPLAKGKLHFAFRPPEGDCFEDTKRRELRLSLFLNPTRYLRHQVVPPFFLEPPNTWSLGEANFRTRSIPRRRRVGNESPGAEVETSLDGNDNVLLSEASLSFGRPEAWPIHLRRYLAKVEDELDAEFNRAANAIPLSSERGHRGVSRAYYYSLKKVETYFEFTAPNPTNLVRQLQSALESIGIGNTSRTYAFGLYTAGTGETNARSVMIALPGGRFLRVYAKTTRRIRFEIIHDTTTASITKLLHAEGGGHTTENREELLGWFRLLAVDAAKALNNVLSILESRSQVPIDSADTYEFLGEIFGIVRNACRAKDLVKLLVENGSLHVGRRGTDFLPEIQQLRRKGFIIKEAGADVVAPRYRAALDQLRTQAGLPPLTLPHIAPPRNHPEIRVRKRPRGNPRNQ